MEKETLEKILGRKEYEELVSAKYSGDKRILITGANGSIGMMLQDRLRGRNVYATDIEKMDITNEAEVKHVLESIRPEIIIHLAGAKHAPEGEHETEKTFSINVIGTRNILKHRNGATVILASTCKSCNPETVYGATKLIAERMVLNEGGSVARFFNVVETQGNVFEIWNREKDIDVAVVCKRYFISLNEAVGLLIKTMTLEKGRYIVNSDELRSIFNIAKNIHSEKQMNFIVARRGDRFEESFKGTNESQDGYFENNSIIKLHSHNDL